MKALKKPSTWFWILFFVVIWPFTATLIEGPKGPKGGTKTSILQQAGEDR